MIYIQGYFKNGKPKKSKAEFKSLKDMATLFEDISGTKEWDNTILCETQALNRDVIFPDGSTINLWDALKLEGFTKVEQQETH